MISVGLGDGDIKTDLEGHTKLIEFFERCHGIKAVDVLIDFSKLTWVDANMSALLMAILKKLEKENQLKFYVDSQMISERFKVLTINGFMPIAELVPGQVNKSSVKLKGFNKNEDGRFIQYIERELLSHEKLLLGTGEKGKLVDSFLELFSNVQQHADTDDPIFACFQFYPTRQVLSFTLVDLGRGYLPAIKQATNGTVYDAAAAIKWALQGGNTTKTDAPGGLGLSEIFKFCQSNNAIFDIITGNAYWRNRLPQPQISKLFCGSMVNVIFDCNDKSNG